MDYIHYLSEFPMLNSPIIIVPNALFLGEGLYCLALACKNWYYIIYLLKEEGKCVYIGMCFNLSLHPWQGNFDRLLWMCILQWSLDCLALTINYNFPRSWLITGFVTRLTRRVSLVERELLTLQEHMSSPPVFSGVRVTRTLVLYVCFVFFLLAIVLSFSSLTSVIYTPQFKFFHNERVIIIHTFFYNTFITQVVVNLTTIRSRLKRPPTIYSYYMYFKWSINNNGFFLNLIMLRLIWFSSWLTCK
jgi:hypothetical protein